MLEIDRAGLLVLLLAGPRPNRPFVVFDMQVDEACLLDRVVHGVDGVNFAAGSLRAFERVGTPCIEDARFGDAAVVASDDGAGF